MKKLIAIVMTICIMFCGCSKSSETPVSDAQPTNIPTETLKAEITSIEMPCDICHLTGNCKPYDCKRLNTEDFTYTTINYFVCEKCWTEIMDIEQDRVTYETLMSTVHTIIDDPKAQTYYSDKGLYISLAPQGIIISPAPDDWLESKLKDILGENCMTEIKSVSKDEKHNVYLFAVIDGKRFEKDFPPKSAFFPDEKSIKDRIYEKVNEAYDEYHNNKK